MELELHVARFSKNSKKALKSFKKIGTKNLDIDNDEIYYCAKNQSENYCILGSGKITNLPKFLTSELCTVR
jgi:hypothetical protein